MTVQGYNQGRHLLGPHRLVIRPAMREALRLVRNGQCVHLIGGRRFGKTVTLQWLTRALWGGGALPETLVITHSLQSGGADPARLFAAWAGTIRRAIAKVLRRAELPLDHPLPTTWDAAAGPWHHFREWLLALLDHVDATYGALPIVLAIDEGEGFLDLPAPYETLGHLRSLLQETQRLRLIVTSYHALHVYRDDRDRLSPLRNICVPVPLALLDGADVHALTSPLLDGIDDTRRDAIASWLRAEAGGHPYLLQCLCDRLTARLAISPDADPAVATADLDFARSAFADWVEPWSGETHRLFGDALENSAPVSGADQDIAALLCYSGAARRADPPGPLTAPVGRFNRWYRSTDRIPTAAVKESGPRRRRS